ncbi:hypothetical protein HDIA_0160 [Hartmannibacter diazotrophicus]|uniref:Uncharacterized protein n=1 Tax=Hartmannibacter diazotrophicus TaxID=1482074 RepID=A0A2C9D1L5_9HYPH|nr:hypothetical protein [Hartmannibacter diazotrophicus]SON53701.1 hypothetical protein HDIA_0160 [Hartmannibacter diazotrophicus]
MVQTADAPAYAIIPGTPLGDALLAYQRAALPALIEAALRGIDDVTTDPSTDERMAWAVSEASRLAFDAVTQDLPLV